jgi:hypothetical protein
MAYISSNAEINRVRIALQGADPADPGAGYAYVYFKADGLYIELPGGIVVGPLAAEGSPGANLDDLDDVDAALPNDGEVLTYDGCSLAWVPAAPEGGALDDHDHSGDAGDGGTFDAANLTSGAADDGYVLTADGAGGAAWEEAAGGGADADAIHDNVSGEIAAVAEKASPVSADLLLLEDSQASNAKKRVQIGNLPGGSSPTVIGNKWDVDAPPASPHADDDEFDDASLDGAWTEWDPGSRVTVSEGDRHLKLALAASAGNSWGGIVKARPVGDFSVYTRLWLTWKKTVQSAYLALLQDAIANPSTSDFIGVGIWYDANNVYHLVTSNTAYNGSPTQVTNIQFATTTFLFQTYLRLRVVSTTVYYDLSRDGLTWWNLYSAAIGFTPLEVGLIANIQDASITGDAYFDFYRVRTTMNLDDTTNGRNRNIYA